MKKTILSVLIPILISCFLFVGAINIGITNNPEEKQENKIQIVATIFPVYDFAKQIAKDKADVTMLLQPGTESHNYEPSPQDIIKVQNADLFIYTGKYMETWAQNIIAPLKDKEKVVDCSKNITLDKIEEIDEEKNDEHEEHQFETHIWTSLEYASIMCDNILEKLCKVDKKNKEYYEENAKNYKKELEKLDEQFEEVVGSAKRKKIVSASRFPFYYLAKRYGLEYEAAYSSCNEETEVSAQAVAKLISTIQKENIPVIFYEELVEPQVAKTISNQTGVKMLLLHSAHNVSKEDFQNGITYLKIMKQNLLNLKEGLN